jgi:peptidoglycan/LPS O-acetylase OafA/YrhL
VNGGESAVRLFFVDYLRAASVLYIVGFWHLMEYAPGWAGWNNPVTSGTTVVVLGLFVFVSGYLLARRPPEPGWRGLRQFYERRLLRVYPLYLAALLIFGLMGLAGWRVVALSAAGVSLLIGPAPFTLWFVVMLLAYYLAAPLLIRADGWRFVGISASLLAVAAFAIKILPSSDPRLLLYFPAFILGVRHAKRPTPATRGAMAAALIVTAIVAAAAMNSGSTGLARFALLVALAALGAYAVFIFAEHFAARFAQSRAVGALSYAAFVMYLVHRPAYEMMSRWHVSSTAHGQLLYLCGVCLPVVIAASWLIQRGYDAALRGRA